MSEHLLIRADARRIPLADQSVHMVCTSPTYWPRGVSAAPTPPSPATPASPRPSLRKTTHEHRDA